MGTLDDVWLMMLAVAVWDFVPSDRVAQDIGPFVPLFNAIIKKEECTHVSEMTPGMDIKEVMQRSVRAGEGLRDGSIISKTMMEARIEVGLKEVMV